jgi:hypothetical protein
MNNSHERETDRVTLVFYFQVFDGPLDAESSFTSHYFNIVNRAEYTTQSVVTATINPYAAGNPSSSVAPIMQTFTLNPDLTIQAAIQSEAPTTSTSLTSASATTTSSSTHTASATGEPSGNGGLSTGAKIGIGVGVGVGAVCLGLGVLIGFCIWRRGKRRAGQTQPQEEQKPFTASQPTTSGYAPGFSADPKYAPVQQFVPHEELPAEERPQEMFDARYSTQELPGSHPYQPYERTNK